MKKRKTKTFEETCKPMWDKVLQMGLTEKDLNDLVDEARTKRGGS